MTNESFARVTIDALLAAQGRDVLDTSAYLRIPRSDPARVLGWHGAAVGKASFCGPWDDDAVRQSAAIIERSTGLARTIASTAKAAEGSAP